MTTADENTRPDYDKELVDIANYVVDFEIPPKAEVYDIARLCFLDALGCGMLALRYPECVKLLGPITPGTVVSQGAKVPGTRYFLDPVQAAFNIGVMNRWLDFNDAFLAAEWAHPSDNLGAILAVCDYQNRRHKNIINKDNDINKDENIIGSINRMIQGNKNKKDAQKTRCFTIKDILTAMIKAHEIQGVLSLENSFNRLGFDHVGLVKVASTALATYLLDGNKKEIMAALSQSFIDGQSLRTYRHAPNAGSRKSWAAGDACSRAVRLAMMTLAGEEGYPSVLTAKNWGFYDVVFKGKPFKINKPYGCYVMENVIFKAQFPAEMHAQTAVECALKLHHIIKDKYDNNLDKIKKIQLNTHESAIRIISKTGKLHNFADRDHCIQYMIAVALLFGELTADSFTDKIASDPRIDKLREKIEVVEDIAYSKDYLEPSKRSAANALQITFSDGTTTDKVVVEYPLGHKARRQEGNTAVFEKFKKNVASHFPKKQLKTILSLCDSPEKLDNTLVDEFVDLWVF